VVVSLDEGCSNTLAHTCTGRQMHIDVQPGFVIKTLDIGSNKKVRSDIPLRPLIATCGCAC
jgi:hypothetical protein